MLLTILIVWQPYLKLNKFTLANYFLSGKCLNLVCCYGSHATTALRKRSAFNLNKKKKKFKGPNLFNKLQSTLFHLIPLFLFHLWSVCQVHLFLAVELQLPESSALPSKNLIASFPHCFLSPVSWWPGIKCTITPIHILRACLNPSIAL